MFHEEHHQILEDFEQYTFQVKSTDSQLRLDKFLAECLAPKGFSREKIKKYIADGQVKINEKICSKANTKLLFDDMVCCCLAKKNADIQPVDGNLDVLYEDAFLAVIDKRSDTVIHPCPSHQEETLAHYLLHRFPALKEQGGDRPGIVHRLDKDTTGLLLVALSESMRLCLAEEFAERRVYKEYLALLEGVPKNEEGSIDLPIGRHKSSKTKMQAGHGKKAESFYRVLYADPQKKFSLVAVRIFTGRTHQVRVHMQSLGHPLLGDNLYGAKDTKGICRPMLHAWRLSFQYPEALFTRSEQAETRGKKRELAKGRAYMKTEGRHYMFVCPPPTDFIHFMTQRLSLFQPIVLTGNAASGKSSYLDALKAMGVPTLNADSVVSHLYEVGHDGWTLLAGRYGDRFVPHKTAAVDKKALFLAMLEDEQLYKEVTSLIYPLVSHVVKDFYIKAHEEGHMCAVAEIPLYFEAYTHKGIFSPQLFPHGSDSPLVLGIYASFEQRKKRMQDTRCWDEKKILTIESWQLDEKSKMALCDYVIENISPINDGKIHADLLHFFEYVEESKKEGRKKDLSDLQALWKTFPPLEDL